MVSELVQYLAGYFNARLILRRVESSGQKEFEYDTSALLYRVRDWFFWIKIVLTLAAAFWLLVTLSWKLV